MTRAVTCRMCRSHLRDTFVDLGMSPLCESYIPTDRLDSPETFYPLHVRVCAKCLLVQLPAYVPGEDIYSDYAYFSSYSDSWVEHARTYAHRMVDKLDLGPDSLVTEVASNDGYLLQHFVTLGVPVVGIEPAGNIAEVAISRGIPTEIEFLAEDTGRKVAERFGQADLVVGNNVYAHVPDLVGFTRGLAELLKSDGLLTLEFPHLLRLVEQNQFDTIYHEHYQYLSLLTASRALESGGLRVIDVEELKSHGGSLRIYARHSGAAGEPAKAVDDVLTAEQVAGLHSLTGHVGFADSVAQVKHDLVTFLLGARADGKVVVGYGAPGKGNTLLNYCGVRSDLLAYTVDRSPAKQGRFLPGTHIPIHDPSHIARDRPDYVLILPWNLRSEIADQLQYVRKWGGQLVVPIPQLEIF